MQCLSDGLVFAGLHVMCDYLRLALATILNAKHGQAAILLAIVCSSWTVVNMGTSGRHICHPHGASDGRPEYVDQANIMASRRLGSIIHSPSFIFPLFRITGINLTWQLIVTKSHPLAQPCPAQVSAPHHRSWDDVMRLDRGAAGIVSPTISWANNDGIPLVQSYLAMA